ncbi:hypothetical protein HHUSO_G18063 [Huso huso]|uniref:Uncharacterized protein n=1 Tax=Huso huso TaxID=61971 RepID=A0ABR0Z6B1_HUSHU
MDVHLVLGLLLMANFGQTSSGLTIPRAATNISTTPDPFCGFRAEFQLCEKAQDFNCSNGNCFCRNKKPYCRCQNYKEGGEDFWYMGENCDQKWSLTNLILVATLPGIALALCVGTVFHCVHYFKKPSGEPEDEEEGKRNLKRQEVRTTSGNTPQENVYHNSIFIPDPEPDVYNKHIDYPPQRMNSQRPQPLDNYRVPQAQQKQDNRPYLPPRNTPPSKPQSFLAPQSSQPPGVGRSSSMQYSSRPPQPAPRGNPYQADSENSGDDDYIQPLPSTVMRPIPKGAVPIFPKLESGITSLPPADYRPQQRLPRASTASRPSYQY